MSSTKRAGVIAGITTAIASTAILTAPTASAEILAPAVIISAEGPVQVFTYTVTTTASTPGADGIYLDCRVSDGWWVSDIVASRDSNAISGRLENQFPDALAGHRGTFSVSCRDKEREWKSWTYNFTYGVEGVHDRYSESEDATGIDEPPELTDASGNTTDVQDGTAPPVDPTSPSPDNTTTDAQDGTAPPVDPYAPSPDSATTDVQDGTAPPVDPYASSPDSATTDAQDGTAPLADPTSPSPDKHSTDAPTGTSKQNPWR